MPDFTALPIPYVPIADKATEVRAAVGLAPDTTGNTNLNAILAAGPAASREALEIPRDSIIPAMRIWQRGPVAVMNIGIIGDSTAISGSWTSYLAARIASENPDATVRRYNWVDATQKMPGTTVQTGSGGDYYIEAIAGAGNVTVTLPILTGQMFSGDLEVFAKISTPDWTPASPIQILNCSNASNKSAFSFRLDSSGKLHFYWASVNGLASPDKSKLSTVATGFSDGATGWVKATLDLDNGASGHDVKFWTSLDGETWTQLGSTITTAGITTLASDWSPEIYIGSLSTLSSAIRVFDVGVKNGIDGQIMTQPLSEYRANTPGRLTIGGSRELRIYCAAQPGGDSPYWTEARLKKALPWGTSHIIHALGHNEYGTAWGSVSAGIYKTVVVDPLIARLTAAAPYHNLVATTQNPVASTYTAKISWEGAFHAMQSQVFQMTKIPTVDVYSAMIDDGFLDEWTADGIHPTAATYEIWANYINDAIFTF
jgi:hypothetical protein